MPARTLTPAKRPNDTTAAEDESSADALSCCKPARSQFNLPGLKRAKRPAALLTPSMAPAAPASAAAVAEVAAAPGAPEALIPRAASQEATAVAQGVAALSALQQGAHADDKAAKPVHAPGKNTPTEASSCHEASTAQPNISSHAGQGAHASQDALVPDEGLVEGKGEQKREWLQQHEAVAGGEAQLSGQQEPEDGGGKQQIEGGGERQQQTDSCDAQQQQQQAGPHAVAAGHACPPAAAPVLSAIDTLNAMVRFRLCMLTMHAMQLHHRSHTCHAGSMHVCT